VFQINHKGKLHLQLKPDAYDKEQLKLVKYFGILLANSIRFSQIIGVEFDEGFIKAFYGENVVKFEDLSGVLDSQTYKNYESMRNMADYELTQLHQDFTVVNAGVTFELKEDGRNHKVSKNNLEEYLNVLAKYYLIDANRKALDAFKEGFSMLIPVEIIKKWIAPNELSYFTAGTLILTGELITKILTFKRANLNDTLNFKRYISEAKPEMLRNLLKFVSGSPAMPYLPESYVITVVFNNLSVQNLPNAHTCNLEVEMPHYESYEQMKTKCDLAFKQYSEGFGFI